MDAKKHDHERILEMLKDARFSVRQIAAEASTTVWTVYYVARKFNVDMDLRHRACNAYRIMSDAHETGMYYLAMANDARREFLDLNYQLKNPAT